jgi:hypothetical protein
VLRAHRTSAGGERSPRDRKLFASINRQHWLLKIACNLQRLRG